MDAQDAKPCERKATFRNGWSARFPEHASYNLYRQSKGVISLERIYISLIDEIERNRNV